MRYPRGTRRIATLAVAAVACSVALGGCDAASSGKGLPPSSDPALDAGRVLIETKCSLCHTLDRIKAADHDGPAWEATIARMRQNGAVVTEAEAQSILNYLADR